MKKIILSAVAALALMAAPAMATDFSVFGSYWDTKDADEALGGGAKFRFGRFVEVRGTYFSDVTADTDPESRDFEISAIPVEAGLVFNFAEDAPVSPYLGGGVGYYFLDTENFEIDDEVGFYAVAGLEFGRRGSGLGFMAEAIYRQMEGTVRDTEGSGLPDDFDEDVDIQLEGMGVNAGLVWRF